MPMVHLASGAAGPRQYDLFLRDIYRRLRADDVAAGRPSWGAALRRTAASATVHATILRHAAKALAAHSLGHRASGQHRQHARFSRFRHSRDDGPR